MTAFQLSNSDQIPPAGLGEACKRTGELTGKSRRSRHATNSEAIASTHVEYLDGQRKKNVSHFLFQIQQSKMNLQSFH